MAGIACLAGLVPAAASAADRIAYDCDSDICTINPDSPSSVTNLTQTTLASENYPVWSPDGTQIAFRGSYSPDWPEIYTLSLDNPGVGVNVSQTADRSEGISAPQWSPDGTQLAFDAEYISGPDQSKGDDTFVSPSDGSSPPVAYGSTTAGEEYPTYAPSGNRIAFDRLPGGVFVANVDGSGAATALPGGGLGYGPSWSPDGTRIAVTRANGGSSSLVRVIKANSSGDFVDLTVASGNDVTPIWSPDSKKLVWTTPSGNLHVAPADGSGDGIDITDMVSGNPAFSPDGKRIAFNGVDGDSHGQIYVVPANGSADPHAVTSTGFNNVNPSWKPAPGGTKPPPGHPAATIKFANFGSHGPVNPHTLSVGIACHVDGHTSNNPACHANADGFTRGQTNSHPRAAKAKGSKLLVIKGSATIRAGKTKRLRFKVTRAGAKLLKAGRTLKTRVTIRVTQKGSKTVTKSKTVKLRV